jgi:hypothetical protein
MDRKHLLNKGDNTLYCTVLIGRTILDSTGGYALNFLFQPPTKLLNVTTVLISNSISLFCFQMASVSTDDDKKPTQTRSMASSFIWYPTQRNATGISNKLVSKAGSGRRVGAVIAVSNHDGGIFGGIAKVEYTRAGLFKELAFPGGDALFLVLLDVVGRIETELGERGDDRKGDIVVGIVAFKYLGLARHATAALGLVVHKDGNRSLPKGRSRLIGIAKAF